VSAPPSVEVRTPTGRAISGLPVTFAVTGGGGSLAGAVTATDASGIATVGSWTLGAAAGLNTVSATATPPHLRSGVDGSPLTFSATGVALLDTLVNCPRRRGEGDADDVSRAFYLPHFPGSSLAQVNLYLSVDDDGRRDRARGPVTILLIARSGGFDGRVIGVSTATVRLQKDRDLLTPFAFAGTPAVERNSTVTFQFAVPDTHDRAKVRFGVGSCGLGNPHCSSQCPVVETRDAGGRLSAFRRKGCGITIIGGR